MTTLRHADNYKFGTAAYATMFAILAGPLTTPQTSLIGDLLQLPSGYDRHTGSPIQNNHTDERYDFTTPSTDKISYNQYSISIADRKVTDSEKAIGELRGYNLLNANWDGEGAITPDNTSISNATAFIEALPENSIIPEPMLLPSGRVGLLWNSDDLYADLEFYGDKRITYFIKRSAQDKHRGVTIFDGKTIPRVFASLLS